MTVSSVLDNIVGEVTDDDIKRIIRQAIMAEHDAVNLYEQVEELVKSSYPELASLFKDIVEEETVHIGEFERALEIFSLGEADLRDEGHSEASEIVG